MSHTEAVTLPYITVHMTPPHQESWLVSLLLSRGKKKRGFSFRFPPPPCSPPLFSQRTSQRWRACGCWHVHGTRGSCCIAWPSTRRQRSGVAWASASSATWAPYRRATRPRYTRGGEVVALECDSGWVIPPHRGEVGKRTWLTHTHTPPQSSMWWNV